MALSFPAVPFLPVAGAPVAAAPAPVPLGALPPARAELRLVPAVPEKEINDTFY